MCRHVKTGMYFVLKEMSGALVQFCMRFGALVTVLLRAVNPTRYSMYYRY